MSEKTYLDVEDLEVYQKLCRLHLEVSELTHQWPAEERYELGSQARRSSNSSPAQLAEKNDDRHLRNKIEGVNRSRGEAAETIHHLFVAKLKGYLAASVFDTYRTRYKECIRMLKRYCQKLWIVNWWAYPSDPRYAALANRPSSNFIPSMTSGMN